MTTSKRDWNDVEVAARRMAGNWRQFDSFLWRRGHGLPDADHWLIVYTSHRDAGLLALREEAGLTQRELGQRLHKPQSWVYNCETANRRVDVTEFIAWARACAVDEQDAFARFLQFQESTKSG